MAINLSDEKVLLLDLKPFREHPIHAHILTTGDVHSEGLFYNGKKMALQDEQLPEISGQIVGQLRLHPLSYGFSRFSKRLMRVCET